MNLNTKYILSTVCILIIIIGGFAYQSYYQQEKEILEDEKKKVSLVSELIIGGLTTEMLEGGGSDFQQLLETLTAKDMEKAWVFNSEGKIISSSVPSMIGGNAPQQHVERFKKNLTDIFSHEEKGETVYSQIIPIHNEKRCQLCHSPKNEVLGVLDVEVSMGRTLQRISESKNRILIFSVVMIIAVSGSLGLLTTFLVNNPIKALISAMKKAEGGDLNVKFLTSRKDEIGKLASSFNHMLQELNKTRQTLEQCHMEEKRRIEAMATLGELSAIVAHEIKNPLAGISGVIQVLAEDMPYNHPQKGVMTEVLSEIERLDKAVKDLLSFARPPEPNLVRTSLQQLLDRARRLIDWQAQKQAVAVKMIPGNSDMAVNIDPEQMQQVFLNIMLNALQSMQSGGILTIASSLNHDTNEVEITFSDTGRGISEDEISNIFKPFFTTKSMGTGLGLAISRDIVEKHGGKISVSSLIGVGSTFRVILKVSEGEDRIA